jgi:hypothetical protein
MFCLVLLKQNQAKPSSAKLLGKRKKKRTILKMPQTKEKNKKIECYR